MYTTCFDIYMSSSGSFYIYALYNVEHVLFIYRPNNILMYFNNFTEL